MQSIRPIAVTTDFVTVSCKVNIERPMADAWARIGDFADAGRFLDVPSILVVGDGEIGSLRRIGDAVLEVMVGRTEASYTYAQIAGPMTPYLYHGCVALSPDSSGACTLRYDVSYDQASMTPEVREAQRERISGRFQGAAEAMKRDAERGERT